jgi:hypothetical protein
VNLALLTSSRKRGKKPKGFLLFFLGLRSEKKSPTFARLDEEYAAAFFPLYSIPIEANGEHLDQRTVAQTYTGPYYITVYIYTACTKSLKMANFRETATGLQLRQEARVLLPLAAGNIAAFITSGTNH